MNALTVLGTNLSDLMALPDEPAAVRLNERIVAFNIVDELHERSYVERGLIAVQFEKRSLWKYLIDPDTNTLFASFTAWMSCSQFMGCRRTNFEAKADIKALADVPEEKLIGIDKSNLHVLKQLSTAVRNDPAILEAAKTLPQKQFMEKIEREQPLQHVEARGPLRLSPTRDERRDIDRWTEYALEHDLAGSVTDAIAKACVMALHDSELDEELAHMPVEDECPSTTVN